MTCKSVQNADKGEKCKHHFSKIPNNFCTVTVVPPTNISMVGYSSGQRIDIRENEEFELTCKVSNAKPVAQISWYRDNVKYDAAGT